MNIGYIKSAYVLGNDEAYRNKIEKLNVAKIYGDKLGETTGLQRLLDYVRQGDCIIVEDIRYLGNTAGEFIELAFNLKQQGVSIVCTAQKINTAMSMWDTIFSYLMMFTEKQTEVTRGRVPRNIEDLYECFDLVEQRQMTVDEACKLMSIGRNTYYRRLRKAKGKAEVEIERHPEQFDYYEDLVAKGEISVTAAARQMNIGITTYYRMRKERQNARG